MKHAAPGTSAGRLRSLSMAAALAVAVTLPLAAVPGGGSGVANAADPSPVGAVTVSGSGPFSDVRVTVDRTSELVNQAVRVSWSGAPVTKEASGVVQANFMQIMQCWAEPGQQPDREQCQFGAFVAVANAGDNVASRQATQFAVDPLECLDDAAAAAAGKICYNRPPGDLALRYFNFTSVDGTREATRYSRFFDAASTNEIPVARTAADGTGVQFFEMQTGLEAPGLGCGQEIAGRTPDCFLVVVPRGSTEVNGTAVGQTSSSFLRSSPLSATNWQHRIVVPLSFRQVGSACEFGRPETSTGGSEFVAEAVSSWQPVLCGLGDRNIGFSSFPDEISRTVLSSDDPGLVFVTKPAAAQPDVVYAPVTVSALSVAVNIDQQLPNRDPQGKPVSPSQVPAEIRAAVGKRFDSVNLTPRLVAKLLTQSYGFDRPYSESLAGSSNPLTPVDDPDFLAHNPAFRPQGYQMTIANGVGRMLVSSGLSDSADLLWRYALSDSEGVDFLNGKPDPWGMVLNERFAGLQLPTNSFPRADLGCGVPPTAPGGFTLESCTLDNFPYASSFSTAARQASRGDTGRRVIPRMDLIQSFGLEPAQYLGERSMLALTDSVSAARYDLVRVALRNAAGRFVSPTESAMNAAVAAMTRDPSGMLQPNLKTPVEGSYPLTVVTYAATRPAALSTTQRQDYATLLEYAATAGQVRGPRAGQLPDGYASLPAALQVEAVLAAQRLRSYVPPSSSPSPTPTPTATPAPSASPTPPAADSGGTGASGGELPASGPALPVTTGTQEAPAPGATPTPAPTSSPSVTPVAASAPTPADPTSTARYAVVVALLLGGAALLARVALPWTASRPPGPA